MSDAKILSSSAVMAAGTLVSRMSGYVRSVLLVWALGGALRGDLFTIANSLPNMIYILVAGGIFNAVLVPQLVRHIKESDDDGEGYSSRLITLSMLVLGAVTVLLIVFTPDLLLLYLDSKFAQETFAPYFDSIVTLTRLCLPQVFFYAMFVLLGQVLNARGVFGPMMWAPIANNIISVGMLIAYLLLFGPTTTATDMAVLTSHEELLLGIGSTVGIAAQLLVLLPYLRRAGFTYRPRFDFRDAGLGHTLRLGWWTVLFVVVNQIALFQVLRLASWGSANKGTGYTVYQNTMLIMMVPHAIVTVSLATAILPRMSSYAADGELAEIGRTVSETLRTALVLVLPIAAFLPLFAPDIAIALWGWAGAETAAPFAPALAVFGPALIFFTVHYLMLRGFYALEQTRRVFFIQCAVAGTNVVAAYALVWTHSPQSAAPMLALAYLLSYAVGASISFVVLRGTVGGMRIAELVGFVGRMAVAVLVAAAAAWLAGRATGTVLPTMQPDPLNAAARLVPEALVGGVVLLGVARMLRIGELTSLLDLATSRLRRR